MVTISLWHIKGRLSDLIDYVENPENTVPKGTEDFFNVFSYIQNPQKTADVSFVTAINCLKHTALRQMILTKQRYSKEDKYIAWHGYQSFQPGKVTPEQCHEIGVKLAQEMWGDRFQVIVTTHLDDLLSAREAIQGEMDTLTELRTRLQNKIRRASPAEKERLRGEKLAITAQITAYCKKLKLNVGVEKRSVKIQDTMDMVYANEEKHRQTEQERKRGTRNR